MYSRVRFSVSSSSFLVFKEVLLEAALFVPALAAAENRNHQEIRLVSNNNNKKDSEVNFLWYPKFERNQIEIKPSKDFTLFLLLCVLSNQAEDKALQNKEIRLDSHIVKND